MISDSVGHYEYDYTFTFDALYGEYDILYKATAYDGTVTIMRNSIMLFRNDIITKVRRYSGISRESIIDEDLCAITIEALHEALDEAFDFHHEVQPICDPDYGVLFDGSNTIVRTPDRYLADHDFDGSVIGQYNTAAAQGSCNGDVYGYWIDSNYGRQGFEIYVNDTSTGRITITQTDGVTPIPADHQGVYLSYWTEWESYEENIFLDAVAYLSAHHAILRMTDLHRATGADLPSNQKKIELNLNRFYNKYEMLMSKISRPKCDGVR